MQAVALLLLRDVAKTHTQPFLEARTDALPLMVALESSPVADVAAIARDALRHLANAPLALLERSVQVRSAKLDLRMCLVVRSGAAGGGAAERARAAAASHHAPNLRLAMTVAAAAPR